MPDLPDRTTGGPSSGAHEIPGAHEAPGALDAPGDPEAATPTTVPDSVIVVGGGLAALRTLAELRAGGFTGHLTVVADEAYPPYGRPPLSKELFTRDVPDDLAAGGLGDIDELADEVLRPARALTVHADDSAVRVMVAHVRAPDEDPGAAEDPPTGDDGPVLGARLLTADVLVVATGARPVLPEGWDGALTLRTWDDAARLRSRLTPGTHLVVVGAGWIGAEVAGVAAARGVRVTVLEAGATPLAAQLPAELGRRMDWYADAGVELRTGARVRSVRRLPAPPGEPVGRTKTEGSEPEGNEPDPRAGPSRFVVDLGEETIEADVVLAALGVLPATEFLGDGVARDAAGAVRVHPDGRPVDGPASLRVVGDAATVEGPGFTLTGGHQDGALQHPVALAAALLGRPIGPLPAETTDSRQLGHDVQTFGDVAPGAPWLANGDIIVREDEAGWTALLVDADGALRGAVLVDHPRDAGPLRKALRGPATPTVDRDRLADPTVPLRTALRS